MKTASINEIQKELKTLEPKAVLDMCMRLAKYKKENKELLTYLLFEANNEAQYIQTIKEEIDSQFMEMNRSNSYLEKKNLRKTLRTINKFVKYSGIKQTEIELRIYFCTKIKSARINLNRSAVLSNLYNKQVEKIKTLISKLHEDLQYDFQNELEGL